MYITKKALKQIIIQEIKKLDEDNIDESLRSGVAKIILGIATALAPMQATAHSGHEEINFKDTKFKTDRASINVDTKLIDATNKVYASDGVIEKYGMKKILDFIVNIPNDRLEIIKYLNGEAELDKDALLTYDKQDINLEKVRPIIARSISDNVNNATITLLTEEEITEEFGRAVGGIYYSGNNAIRINASVLDQNEHLNKAKGAKKDSSPKPSDVLLKHELIHSGQSGADKIVGTYRQTSSGVGFRNFKPGFEQQNDNFTDDRWYQYVRTNRENSAHTYEVRRLLGLSSYPSKQDIIDGFKKYGIKIVNINGNYGFVLPSDINPGNLQAAFSTIKNNMEGLSFSQVQNSIEPFLIKVETIKNENILFFNLQNYVEMLNKTAAKTTNSTKSVAT